MTRSEIVTDRLILRSIKQEDGPFCLSMWLDDEMGKYLSDSPKDKAEDDELNFAEGIEDQNEWYPFIAILRETGELIGMCSAVPEDDIKEWDLGYCIHKNYWRNGYATEMVQAIINWGYQNGVRRFTAEIAQENAGSNAVIRKLGFRVEGEGTFRKRNTDIIYDQYIYSLELE